MSGRAPACISRLTHSRCPAVAAAPSADHPTFPSALRMGGGGHARTKSTAVSDSGPRLRRGGCSRAMVGGWAGKRTRGSTRGTEVPVDET
eukprot:scaffold502_cov115-Isochrysis_galbana.AAC.10